MRNDYTERTNEILFGGPIFTGIEITETEWHIAQLTRSSNAITVTRRVVVRFGPLPHEDDLRINAKAEALKVAIKQNKLAISEARLCISKAAVAARYRRLPPSNDALEIAQMARFEAERHIPFNPERHIYDHLVMRRDPLAGNDVMTLAVDSPVVNEALAVCAQVGIDAAVADVSTLALYRLYMMRKRTDGDAAEGTGSEPTTALFHIGRSRSEVVLIQDDIVLFARSANQGTNQLLEALAPDGPTELGKIDLVKALAPSPPSPDPATEDADAPTYDMDEGTEAPSAPPSIFSATDTGRIFAPRSSDLTPEQKEAIRTWFDRLMLDMQRAYDFAYREFNCPPISVMHLSGAGVRIGRIREYLTRELNIQIDLLLENLPLPVKERFEKKAPPLADPLDADVIAMGAALDSPPPINRTVNLLPPEHLRKRRMKAQISSIVTTIFLAICALALGGFYFHQHNRDRAIELQAMKDFVKEHEAIVSEVGKMEREIAMFEDFLATDRNAIHILDRICAMPITQERARLYEYQFTKGDALKLTGYADTIVSINEFHEMLRNLEIFSDVELSQQKNTTIPGFEAKQVWQFIFICSFEETD